MAVASRKLDLPIGKLDDWDLLQAAFEGYIEEAQSLPTVDASQILKKEFPSNQSKSAQVQRLKQMLSQRNEWAYSQTSPLYETPQQILTDALACIQNEKRLSQKKTVRQLLGPYLETSEAVPNMRHFQRLPWTQRFRRDFWEYLAALKIKGTDFFPAEAVSKASQLAPGEQRTLEALKQAAPHGKSVRELCTLTQKDALAEETPRGSMDAWLSNLKAKELVRADQSRPKHWFFVKDFES